MHKGQNPSLITDPDSSIIEFHATVNGQEIRRDNILADILLIDFLHEELEMTGTKFSCGIGACSSCKVAARQDADEPWFPVLACYARLSALNGFEIRTVEGLAEKNQLHPLQEEFVNSCAFQCGFSTPGMLMAGFILIDNLTRNPIFEEELEDRVKLTISGHLCRCTGYIRYHSSICKVIKNLVEKGELSWRSESETEYQSPITFEVIKQSGNDRRAETVYGWIHQPDVTWSTTLSEIPYITVDFPLSAIRTGIRVRDLNLQRFLFSPYKKLRFETELMRPETREPISGWGNGVPVFLEGRVTMIGDTLRSMQIVKTNAVFRRSDEAFSLQSIHPIRLDMTKIELPIIEFAKEFGIHLDAIINIHFNVISETVN